jgi:hypothetical protein
LLKAFTLSDFDGANLAAFGGPVRRYRVGLEEVVLIPVPVSSVYSQSMIIRFCVSSGASRTRSIETSMGQVPCRDEFQDN